MQVRLAVVTACLFALGCGSGSKPAPVTRIAVWISENQPERVAATKANVREFTRRTGIEVELTALADDELPDRIVAASDGGGELPDVMQVSIAEAQAYARQGVLDARAAQQVVRGLGEETFSARALGLFGSDGRMAAVPSDGWGQLLIYRKDLFREAGLRAPQTLADVRRAARRLDRGGMAGITLATEPGEGFTAESFEHVALASGCQLVDDRGRIRLTSAACERAFAAYVDLARHSRGGEQDVDTTRATYFAGRAGMIFWSPFLLDALAGLRDDAKPTCDACAEDPAYLARNSGLVGPLIGPDGAGVQFGTLSGWGIVGGGRVPAARRFVDYMLSDGYVRWLAVSPQGKYPVRLGGAADPQRYVREWRKLESGVDRRAPLSDFYSADSIRSLGDGVRNFRRWGYGQGEIALVGELAQTQPITEAVAAAIRGDATPGEAARMAQRAVEALRDTVG